MYQIKLETKIATTLRATLSKALLKAFLSGLYAFACGNGVANAGKKGTDYILMAIATAPTGGK